MLVRIVAYNNPQGMVRSLNLSPFEIPRKGDAISFRKGAEVDTLEVRAVVWEYDSTTGGLREVRLMVVV